MPAHLSLRCLVLTATISAWGLVVPSGAAELNPANAYARVEAARTHLELGRVDIAIDELSLALESDANLAEAYVLLASAYKKDGRADMAAAALDEAKRFEATGK